MEIEIISFGKIAELVNLKNLNIDGIKDTDGLQKQLEAAFPKLKETKYKLALNKQIIHVNSPLASGSVVAIMPPFSGG